MAALNTVQESSARSSVDPDRLIISSFARQGAKSKIELLSVESEDSMTFCIWEEDHTIGNSLRHIIMKNAHVEFCGYSMPHPSEAKVHLRIQTNGRISALDAFRQGLADLKNIALHVQQSFQSELSKVDFEEAEQDDA